MNYATIKLYFKRYKGLVAYLLLAIVTAYSIKLSSANINTQREVRANDIVATLAQGAVSGCVNANLVTQGIHKVVVSSYSNGQGSINELVKEGTLSAKQAVRIRENSRTQIMKSLADLPYRDCASSAERYVKQITDSDQRNGVRAEVLRQVRAALQIRRQQEPKVGGLNG